MIKNFILLCDHASIDENKKLNLIGIYEEMRFHTFPAVVLKTIFVANFNYDKDHDDLTFNLDLLDPKGKKVGINIPPIKQASTPTEIKKLNILVELGNLKLEAPGKYKFELKGNNQKLGEIEFEVKKI